MDNRIERPFYTTICSPDEFDIAEFRHSIITTANKNKAPYSCADVGMMVGIIDDYISLLARLEDAEKVIGKVRAYKVAYNKTYAHPNNDNRREFDNARDIMFSMVAIYNAQYRV